MGMTTNCCERATDGILTSNASRLYESTSEISYLYPPAGIVPEPCILLEVKVNARTSCKLASQEF